MAEAWPYLVSGVVFGLAAGVSPGPMLALVVSQTLRRGRRAGLLVALAPLGSDAPIVAASLLLLARLARSDLVLGLICLGGAAFVAWLAWESLRVRGLAADSSGSETGSLARGVALNLLNPNPYLFWIAVGAPTVLAARARGWLAPAAFLVSFYVLLVGSKMAVAVLVDGSRAVLAGRAYVWVMRGLGLALAAFAALFARDGVGRLLRGL